MSYSNINNPVNYQLQGFGQNGVRTISTDQLYIQGEYYRVLVAEEDSYVTAVSVLGDDLTAEFVYAGTTIYGLFTEVSVSSGSLTAYIAGPTDIEDVWAYINAYGQTNAARIEAADCAKDTIAPLLDKYYAKASLVMVPSLYKTSIVYSERPLTTSGQLDFTRSNDTATRVGPDGYIEKVRTNVALYSQAYSSGAWLTLNSTKVSTSATDPNGGSTACNITWGAGTNAYLYQSIAQTGYYTVSMWVKSNGGGNNFRLFGDGTASYSPNFTATSSWQRFSFTFNGTGGSSWGISHNSTQNAANLLVAFAQLETGDIATDYIPTTASAVSVGPVANLPRLNYPINSDGSVGCPSLLLEPQRINIQLNSEDFSQSNWTNTNSAIITNQVASPDGYVNADKLNETAVNNIHQLESSRSVSSSTVYTMSAFAKKAERSWVRIYEDTTSNSAYFNLDSGTVGTVSGPTAVAKIENYGNGWYRCSVTYTETGTFGRYRITTAKQDNEASYLGVVNNGIYVWGAQYEVGSYATSYIPTLGASVTRGADACSKTGISSLIGQTQGTMFLDVVAQVDTVESQDFSISDGTASNRASIRLNNSGLINAIGVFGGSVQFSMGTDTYVTGQRYKIALAYKLNDVVLYVNGVQSATDTSATISGTLSRLGFDVNTTGTQNLKSRVNQAILFKTRLTNQELQDLTTL